MIAHGVKRSYWFVPGTYKVTKYLVILTRFATRRSRAAGCYCFEEMYETMSLKGWVYLFSSSTGCSHGRDFSYHRLPKMVFHTFNLPFLQEFWKACLEDICKQLSTQKDPSPLVTSCLEPPYFASLQSWYQTEFHLLNSLDQFRYVAENML